MNGLDDLLVMGSIFVSKVGKCWSYYEVEPENMKQGIGWVFFLEDLLI
jgi:hypothetical protein